MPINSSNFQNMSLDEKKKLVNEKKEEIKKDYKELREKKMIKKYKKLTQLGEKIRKGIDAKKRS